MAAMRRVRKRPTVTGDGGAKRLRVAFGAVDARERVPTDYR